MFSACSEAAFYYVSPSGSDNSSGTISNPWQTIQFALDRIQSGDTVYARVGTYQENVQFKCSGVTLSGYQNEQVILNGAFAGSTGYGISFDGETDMGSFDNITVQNLTIQNFETYAIVGWINNDNITLSNLIVVGGGEVIKFQANEPRPSDGPSGIVLMPTNPSLIASNILIQNVTATGYSQAGIDLGDGAVEDVTIRDVILSMTETGNDTAADGIAVERGNRITIQRVQIMGSQGDGIDLKANNVLVQRAQVRNVCGDGVKLWGVNAVLEYSFITYNGLTNLVLEGAGPYTIANNNIGDSQVYGYTATLGPYGSSSFSRIILQNNFFFNRVSNNGGTLLYFSPGCDVTATGNTFYQPYRTDAVIDASYSSKASIQQGYGKVFGDGDFSANNWPTGFSNNIYAEAPGGVQPWPAGSGINIGSNLPSGYEPSDAVWHTRLQKLFIVSDEGQVSQMNADGSQIITWSPGGDLEGITIANANSNYIYLGVEHPDSIREFDISTGTLTGRSWSLTPWMTGPDNSGLEALTFVPNSYHPYPNSSSGGLFYTGLQADGKIYIFDVNLSQNGQISYVDTLTIVPGITDIAGLYFDAQTEKLYAIFDSANRLLEMYPDGTVLKEYILPGTEQEGIAVVAAYPSTTASIYILDDSTKQVMKYNSYPVTYLTGSLTTLTRGPFLQMGKTTEVSIIWQTDIFGDSTVEYGPTTDLGLIATGSSGTTHQVNITGLTAGTLYYYRIKTNNQILKVNPSDTVYQFKTHVAPDTAQNFSFAVIGDWGSGTSNETAVKNQIKTALVNFVLTVGDNAYSSGTAQQIQSYVFDVYKDVFHSVFYYPTFGNHDHDTYNGQPSKDAYYIYPNGMGASAEELFYSFDYGDIHFVALDANKSYIGTSLWNTQKTWLEQDLAATSQPFKIVYLHEPAYSSTTSSHGYDPDVRAELVPIFESYHVDAVFQGHNHHYEQFYPILKGAQNNASGVKYYVTGNGGASLYTFSGAAATFSMERNNTAWGYLKCTFNGTTKTLSIEPRDVNGNLMGTTWSRTKVDTDSDGLWDYWEAYYFWNLNQTVGGDADGDELSNLQEYQNNTNPIVSDTDSDGMPDGYELTNNHDPLTNDALQDADSDGLSNIMEMNYGTDSNNTDTDNDGMNDLYEVIAGTNPLSSSSVSSYLFSDNFNDGNYNGWSVSGATSNITWSATNNALVSKGIGTGGYSFIIPDSLNISTMSTLAVSYDVTFSSTNDGWGGIWFRGIHLDVNTNRCGVRDGNYESLPGTYQWYAGVSKGVKHHILMLVKKVALSSSNPYPYRTDLYIDGKPIFINEPIETNTFSSNTVGFISNYSTGTVTWDNFMIYPNPAPLLLPFSDNFNASDYGAWIASGNINIAWDFVAGALRSNISSAVSATGYGYLKHALLDLSGQDITIVLDMTPQNWGGIFYRGVGLDINTSRIGWRDGSYEGHPGNYQWYSGVSAGTSHHIILNIQRSSPYDLSRLSIDGSLIFNNEPIQITTYPDKTIGFISNYFTGANLYDNLNVTSGSAGINLAPTLDGIGAQRVVAGSTLTFQAQGSDPNGDTITYTATGLPAGASINPTTGVFTWVPSSTDVGAYSITVQASDGSLTATETLSITVVTPPAPGTNPGLLYQENFDASSLPSGWGATGATSNVTWSIVGNALRSQVVGTGGYAYLDNTNLNISSNSSIALEYDVLFNNTDGWGGVRFRGINLDLNPNRIGWRDGNHESLPGSYRWFSGLTKNVTHHVILFVRSASPYYRSDLYVDGKPIFIDEPIEATSFPNNTIGFLSHYNVSGSYNVDSIILKDMTQLIPAGFVSASYDFSTNLNSWIGSGNTNDINWTLMSGALVFTVVGTGGYSFFSPYDLYISERNVTVSYDVTFSNSSDGWGGFVYRGIALDVNPNRCGWRDGIYEGFTGTYQWYPGVGARGAPHHVRIAIRPNSPYVLTDLFIDDTAIFTNEPIQTNSFTTNSVGFLSNYNLGSVSIDNVTVME